MINKERIIEICKNSSLPEVIQSLEFWQGQVTWWREQYYWKAKCRAVPAVIYQALHDNIETCKVLDSYIKQEMGITEVVTLASLYDKECAELAKDLNTLPAEVVKECEEVKSTYLVKVAIEIAVTLVDDSPGLLYDALQKPLEELTQKEMQQFYISLEEGVRTEFVEGERRGGDMFDDLDIVSVRKYNE